jgi:hypothetical protein
MPTRVATILHMQTSYDRISRLLARINIKPIHIPTIQHPLLKPVKDDLGLRAPVVYCILCEGSKVYIGQMGCGIDMSYNEHVQHI